MFGLTGYCYAIETVIIMDDPKVAHWGYFIILFTFTWSVLGVFFLILSVLYNRRKPILIERIKDDYPYTFYLDDSKSAVSRWKKDSDYITLQREAKK